MKTMFAALAAVIFSASSADAGDTAAYAPMAAFAPLAGKSFRGEWTDPDGSKIVDLATYELILGGKALQSTHRLEGKDYGGRTIFFYDEGAKEYLFHYFTTAGFHTIGAMTPSASGFATEEKVAGHATIDSVRSAVTFDQDAMRVDVIYVGKDRSETSGDTRLYRLVADPGPLFPDAE